jgi:hypothetical protein
MPRGRHRQSSPLIRLLPPTACGVLAIASLISAAFTSDTAILRILVAAASVGAFAGAVLLRLRESAGQAELEAEVSARVRDEARFEDRTAELEYLAETADEQVRRLERQLLAQRGRLARVENENSLLLSERARIAADQALRGAEEIQRTEAAVRGNRPSPTAYLKAASALRGLERRAAVNHAQRIAAAARDGSAQAVAQTLRMPGASAPVSQGLPAPAQASTPAPAQALAKAQAAAPAKAPAQAQVANQAPAKAQAQAAVADGAAGVTAAQATAGRGTSAPARKRKPRAGAPAPAAASAEHGGPRSKPAAAPEAPAPTASPGPAWARAALPPMRPASAVLPATQPRQSWDLRRQSTAAGAGGGTFNFFSRQEAAISTGLGDLADVVGDEAAAEQDRYDGTAATATEDGDRPDATSPQGHPGDAEPEQSALVDLTADDETEPIDVRLLRDAL